MHPTSFPQNFSSWTTPHPVPLHEAAPVLVTTRLFHRRSRPRLVISCLLTALAVLLLTATRAGAQEDATVGESMIAQQQFLGVSGRNGVAVRSGASIGDLPVTTLTDRQEVVVVGFKNGFLRVLPPEGTFCLVPKARINIRGEAEGERIGRVTDNCSVRVGSTINQAIHQTAVRLPPGEEVNVIGEDSVYYRITPPKGVFFYVAQEDLLRVREVKVTETPRGWKVGELPRAQTTPQVATTTTPQLSNEQDLAQANPVTDGLPTGDEEGEVREAMPPVAEVEEVPELVIPTTQPAVLTQFQEIDARYNEVAQQPLEEQPLEELKKEYEAVLAIATNDPAGQTLVSTIQTRLQTIEVRQAALQDLQAIQAMRQQMAQRQQALDAEQQELTERAEKSKITMYAAVGTIRPSSLQVGGASLFRLCDPATGRTMIYLRASGDAVGNVTKHLEKFVGVKGEVSQDNDLDLTFIKVSDVAAVNQEAVFDTVAAERIPPSMLQSADAQD